MRDLGSCVAWWHLVGGSKRQVYVGVFLHRVRCELTIELAEGVVSTPGWLRDDHIVKPNWSFDSKDKSQKHALSMALKYAKKVCDSRTSKGYRIVHHSFGSDTGTTKDAAMIAWELANDVVYGYSPKVSYPDWWPIVRRLATSATPRSMAARRMELAEEGFDIVDLINAAKDKARRHKRKTDHGKVTKRIGRFTVFVKDAPHK